MSGRTWEKTVPCPKCGRRFTRRDVMIRHSTRRTCRPPSVPLLDNRDGEVSERRQPSRSLSYDAERNPPRTNFVPQEVPTTTHQTPHGGMSSPSRPGPYQLHGGPTPGRAPPPPFPISLIGDPPVPLSTPPPLVPNPNYGELVSATIEQAQLPFERDWGRTDTLDSAGVPPPFLEPAVKPSPSDRPPFQFFTR
ncbi:hypothetical protein M427DRAFT_476295 [Gonapodya prolifera JEL478]|uniref:C2H2-type domain-containing protein n=1 Tax=Gonapodya prolifera (strain JEL478) TaxID=1344416 RepID=A0A139A235_GONPJ|nr:hypothetical protein M427DRAFT_476295 [Gonapodya prolifera JEL478]|eukprot:KXS10605.1 hypothetical protein M427DRAFT_476295 [Gonapodya prolifera JEL478]